MVGRARSAWPVVQNPDVPSAAAFQLAEVLYKGHKKYAIEAVRLNAQRRVDDSLVQTLDIVIHLTGVIQTLGKGTLFTGLAHPVHNGLTMMKESHHVLHGLKVGYGIMVQLTVEKCPKKKIEETLAFFRKLGLEPSLKGLNLPFDREFILRIAEKAANDPVSGPFMFPVSREIIASAMERLEKRLGSPSLPAGSSVQFPFAGPEQARANCRSSPCLGNYAKALRITLGLAIVGLVLCAASLATRDCRIALYVYDDCMWMGLRGHLACPPSRFFRMGFWRAEWGNCSGADSLPHFSVCVPPAASDAGRARFPPTACSRASEEISGWRYPQWEKRKTVAERAVPWPGHGAEVVTDFHRNSPLHLGVGGVPAARAGCGFLP